MRRLALAVALACTLALASSASADQNAPALDRLFDELGAAESASEAVRFESRIWQLWLEPPDAEAGRLMARLDAAMRGGSSTEAAAAADALVERYPDFAEAWNKRATLRYLTGDHDGSVADIERTLALEPRHFGAISGLGLIFLKRGDPAGALDAFEAVLELSPASANARRSVERTREELDGRDI